MTEVKAVACHLALLQCLFYLCATLHLCPLISHPTSSKVKALFSLPDIYCKHRQRNPTQSHIPSGN